MTALTSLVTNAPSRAGLPIDRLAGTLLHQGIGRLFDYFAQNFAKLHLKELSVTALGPGRSMEVAGRRLVNFGSDSFLGLDQDARVQEALARGISQWGTHNGASRAFASVAANIEAERRLARWLGIESVVMYPSVTLANHGAIPGMVGKPDVVVADEQAHNSIHEAAKIARGNGVRTAIFAHDDPDNLRAVLRQLRPYRHALVAVDGVYSMCGSLPPLADIAAVTKEEDGVLYVDDAHATGVLGERGRGTVLHALGSYANTLVAGSLSKAFSCLGGFIGCPASFAQLLRYRSNTYIFGGPVPPPYLEAILAVLDLLESDEYGPLRQKLDTNLHQLIAGLHEQGWTMLGSVTPIVSILIGDEADTLRAGHFLFERGYYVQSVIFPAVPWHAGVLRIQVNANHTPAMIGGLLDAIRTLQSKLPFPSAEPAEEARCFRECA